MHLAQVLPRLVLEGYRVTIQTLAGRGALADRLEAGGVRVVAPTDGARRRCLVGRTARIARAAGSLWRTIRSEKPDVVHFFLPEAYLVGALVSFFAGSGFKRVMSRRSLNDYQAKRPVLALLERFLHGRMDALVGNSAAIVDQLAQEGAPADRLRLIRNGIDFDRFDGHRAQPGSADGRLRLIVVANLIAYKGHVDLIDALVSRRDALPDWELLCVGRDDGIGETLATRARAGGIEARIRFLGARADVPALLSSAHIALLCSHEEGFPNAVIESMAAGLPVIATRVGGVPEAVEHDETGLLVPARDPVALGNAIEALARDPSRRARMGDAGRARAHRFFGLDPCVRSYSELYGRLRRG